MMETDGNTKEKRQILERGEKQKETEKDAQRTEMQRKIDTGREAEKNGGGGERKRQRGKKKRSEKREKERLIHRKRGTGETESTIQRPSERQSREIETGRPRNRKT